MKSEVSYKAGFYNTPTGIQTHVFAPAGVDLRGKWSIGGNAPGEPREPAELGVDKPVSGLYIKEEVELRCNMLMSGFVKRNLKSSHHEVHTKILEKAKRSEHRKTPIADAELLSRAQTQPGGDQIENPTSVLSRLALLPGSNISQQQRELDFACTCEGTTHLQTCSFFHPGDLRDHGGLQAKPHNATSLLPSAPSFSSSPATRPARVERTPSELYGSTDVGQCRCTGGLHEQSCSAYPGLRTPRLPSALSLQSGPNTPPSLSSQSSAPAVPMIAAPVHKRGQRHEFVAQPPGEQVELPGSSFSPADSNWSEREYAGSPLSFSSHRSDRYSATAPR